MDLVKRLEALIEFNAKVRWKEDQLDVTAELREAVAEIIRLRELVGQLQSTTNVISC
jgi:hypothetical protein